MNVYEAMKKRRSIRNYSERKVEDKKLEKILEAGRVAPSGKNAQGLTPLGYPAEQGRDRGRKPLEEIVFQEK